MRGEARVLLVALALAVGSGCDGATPSTRTWACTSTAGSACTELRGFTESFARAYCESDAGSSVTGTLASGPCVPAPAGACVLASPLGEIALHQYATGGLTDDTLAMLCCASASGSGLAVRWESRTTGLTTACSPDAGL